MDDDYEWDDDYFAEADYFVMARGTTKPAQPKASPADALAYHLARTSRRRRRERVAATEFKAKVAPYLVEAPEL